MLRKGVTVFALSDAVTQPARPPVAVPPLANPAAVEQLGRPVPAPVTGPTPGVAERSSKQLLLTMRRSDSAITQ